MAKTGKQPNTSPTIEETVSESTASVVAESIDQSRDLASRLDMESENKELNRLLTESQKAIGEFLAEKQEWLTVWQKAQDEFDRVSAELKTLREENLRLRDSLDALEKPAAPAAPPIPAVGKIKARVVAVGSHVGTIDVEIPSDTPDNERHKAAVEAAKEARGIQGFAAAPTVEIMHP